uniref:Uncharacterized protein n=1 Tax=Arundo donax TaxID=35708 RepID=A0A0A9C210_ARUDO
MHRYVPVVWGFRRLTVVQISDLRIDRIQERSSYPCSCVDL